MLKSIAFPWNRRLIRSTLLLLAGTLATPCRAAEPTSSFRDRIAPLLQERCLRCHSGARPKGEFDLSSREKMLAGGASGAIDVKPGQPAESQLIRFVAEKKMPPRAPLSSQEIDQLRQWVEAGAPWAGGPLKPLQKIEETRAGSDWWSLQPIRRPPLPAVAKPDWVRNPIDAFVLAKLDAAHLSPASECDRRTFIRRVTLDLLGLLPTPDEIEAFERDRAPTAYETLVDRLLASEHYGERWGRHWLDVVRFAESHGYETNALRQNAWPYRDYVIDAFNRDKPFAEFVMDQLAGDAAAADDWQTQAATGFLVGGTHDMVGNATIEGKRQQRSDDLYDMVTATGSTFLGLTVNCARCHDHKFDPILQKDFYSLEAFFAGVQHADRPVKMHTDSKRGHELELLRMQSANLNREIDASEPLAGPRSSTARRLPVSPYRNVERLAPAEAKYVRFTVVATADGIEPCIDELEVYTPEPASTNVALASLGAKATASSVFPNSTIHRIEHVNDGQLGNGRSWISNERGQGWVSIELATATVIDRIVWGRDREQKFLDRLARDYRIDISLDGKNWRTVAGSWDRLPYDQGTRTKPTDDHSVAGALQALLARRKQLEARITELAKPFTIYAGTFGEPEPTYVLNRGDPMQKLDGVGPAGIQSLAPPLALDPKTPERQRRIALASWIADPRLPLPPRVMANRLWHYHFGQGIVRTPSDFGFNGDRPSHPALLDWLAAEFLANGGRLKPLHQLIVLSNTYRQSSRLDAGAQTVDAGNRLLWRFPPRRLEAEVIRDVMLQVSGSLNPRRGGPGYNLWDYSGYVIVFQPKSQLGNDEFRRMVYQFKPRTQQDAIFGAFDCPDATQMMPRRNISTTAIQALNLLNGLFVRDQADRFAQRLRQDAQTSGPQVRRAFALAFGREPSPREASAAQTLIDSHGLATLCRALLNANEFVFAN